MTDKCDTEEFQVANKGCRTCYIPTLYASGDPTLLETLSLFIDINVCLKQKAPVEVSVMASTLNSPFKGVVLGL